MSAVLTLCATGVVSENRPLLVFVIVIEFGPTLLTIAPFQTFHLFFGFNRQWELSMF